PRARGVPARGGAGGPAPGPNPGGAPAGGDEPPDEAGAAAVPEERVEGPAAEEGAQAEPALDSPPWWREGAWPVDAAAQALGAGDDEEELPGPAVSMPAGYGGLASEPEPGAAASGGGDAPPEEAGAAVVPEKPAGGPAVEERAPAEPAMDSPSWREDSPGDAAGRASGSGDHGEEGEAPDRVHPASPAGLPQAPEGPADVPPAELIRSIVAEVCPDELLLVDTTEGPMPEWAHAAVTAARNDLARRSAERRAVDAGEFLRLAIVEHIMGLHEDADGHLKEALPQSERFGPVLNALAVTNLALGKIAPAIVYCKEALRETDGDDAVRAAASSNLGDLYRLQGNASQAAEAYEAAIQSFGSQEEAHGLPRLHFHAGCLYRHLGETDKARAHLSESVRLYKESGDEPGHIRALGTLGLALNDSGLHDLALRSLEEGVRICLRTGDKPGAALVQDGMGLVYMSQGQLTRSLAYLESALSLHRELGDREGEAATRDNIGKIHHSRGEPATRPQESVDREKAPSRFLEAEEILRRAGSAELQEKHEAVDPNARAGNARLG
ncbi:MAG: tetratricopeptide repeat protein, partial [Deltaproteobacteria bacterium]|nr:tetratricopeptide repeat protein [Deltaproteobacteria bacterium]